jgi:ABC-type transport system substrate-binding protein
MFTRREFLAASTAAAALAATPSGAMAQTPKRGGTLAVRAWDPPHFDHSLVHAYKTHGPWMLESYKANVSITLVRRPGYFVPGCPTSTEWEFPGQINRTDWVQIKDRLRQTRPSLRTTEFASNVVNDLSMRTDQKPWSDVRVRQAVSLALDRREIIESTLEGVGVVNGCSRRPATRTAFPPACASTRTAPPSWWTPCSSCSST